MYVIERKTLVTLKDWFRVANLASVYGVVEHPLWYYVIKRHLSIRITLDSWFRVALLLQYMGIGTPTTLVPVDT